MAHVAIIAISSPSGSYQVDVWGSVVLAQANHYLSHRGVLYTKGVPTYGVNDELVTIDDLDQRPLNVWRTWFPWLPGVATYNIWQPSLASVLGDAYTQGYIECLECGQKSFHPSDIKHTWCGRCGDLAHLSFVRQLGWDITEANAGEGLSDASNLAKNEKKRSRWRFHRRDR